MSRTTRIVLMMSLLSAAGAITACGSTTEPTPAPTLSTEAFTGTISPGGTASHTFTVNYTGGSSDAGVTVTSLTSVATGAAQSMTIGIAFGTVNVGACSRLASLSNAAAPLNVELPTTNTPFVAGTFCVQVYDNPESPTVKEPLTYSITVRHY